MRCYIQCGGTPLPPGCAYRGLAIPPASAPRSDAGGIVLRPGAQKPSVHLPPSGERRACTRHPNPFGRPTWIMLPGVRPGHRHRSRRQGRSPPGILTASPVPVTSRGAAASAGTARPACLPRWPPVSCAVTRRLTGGREAILSRTAPTRRAPGRAQGRRARTGRPGRQSGTEREQPCSDAPAPVPPASHGGGRRHSVPGSLASSLPGRSWPGYVTCGNDQDNRVLRASWPSMDAGSRPCPREDGTDGSALLFGGETGSDFGAVAARRDPRCSVARSPIPERLPCAGFLRPRPSGRWPGWGLARPADTGAGSGDGTRTRGLWLMRPASCQLLYAA
jgi:hypothetical protein